MNWKKQKPKGKNQPKPQLMIGDKMTGGPNEVGFDYFYGFTHARNIKTIIEQDTVVKEVKAVENQPLMVAKAIEFLKERSLNKEKPFFNRKIQEGISNKVSIVKAPYIQFCKNYIPY